MLWMIVLGISTGMRTMTAMAVICWFGWLKLLPLNGWAFWAANLVSAIVFTVAALGEYYGDTLPTTPNRTAIGPLLARLVFGGVVGALAATGIAEPVAGGVIFAIVGVAIGAYGGMWLRLALARKLGRDLPVALLESAVALGLALSAAWIFHGYAVTAAAAERTFT